MFHVVDLAYSWFTRTIRRISTEQIKEMTFMYRQVVTYRGPGGDCLGGLPHVYGYRKLNTPKAEVGFGLMMSVLILILFIL